MKNVKKIDLGLTGYDELFMTDAERKENKLPRIYDIPLTEIDDFPDHPFKVKMDEDMDQLVASIKERGLITPITLRPKEDGRYEIVSGHRRKKACELAGLETVKAEVREMSRDEAIILMVESNLQRSVILPSEKAFSYKMRLEANKARKTANFTVEDSCIGCGLCEKKCPVNAIRMADGKPVWIKDKCVMCLGCLHRCPKFAIQYGNKTKNHGQYKNPNI